MGAITRGFANLITADGDLTKDAVQVASASGGGATSQAFNGCFSADYKMYMILANITMSNDAHVYCRFLNSSNAELTGGVYYYQGNSVLNNAGSISNSASGSFGANQVGPDQTIQASASRFALYRIFVHDPFTSATKPNYELFYHCQSANSNLRTVYHAGVYDTAVSAAGFKFISNSAGTIGSNSTFKIYGFK